MEQTSKSYRVIYREKSFAVLEKSSGLLSQSDRGGDEDLISLYAKDTGKTCYPVHRLDRGVGGLLVVATSREAAARLSSSLGSEEKVFHKEYLTVVHGEFQAESGELNDFLIHDERKRKSFCVSDGTPGAKNARLAYRVLGKKEYEGKTYSLLAVLLFTGRTHQIRAQLANSGHPVAGDGRYGASDRFPPLSLYSSFLSFDNPMNRERLSFSVKPIGEAFSLFAIPDAGTEGFFNE